MHCERPIQAVRHRYNRRSAESSQAAALRLVGRHQCYAARQATVLGRAIAHASILCTLPNVQLESSPLIPSPHTVGTSR